MKTETIILLFVASVIVLVFAIWGQAQSATYHRANNEAKCNSIDAQFYNEGVGAFCIDQAGRLYAVPGGYKRPNLVWVGLFVASVMGVITTFPELWERFNQWRKQR